MDLWMQLLYEHLTVLINDKSLLVAAQVNKDAQIKVVSMSPAILVWYQIVTSCNLLVLVFKTVNCNKAVYIDMYFQFCGNGMTQVLSMLPGRCLWSGRSPNDAICCADSSAHIGVIMFCLTWASLLWPRQLQRIMSFDFAALHWTTRWESARWPKNCKKTDDRCSEGQRDLQDQRCTSQFCLDHHEHFCPRNPCNWK